MNCDRRWAFKGKVGTGINGQLGARGKRSNQAKSAVSVLLIILTDFEYFRVLRCHKVIVLMNFHLFC